MWIHFRHSFEMICNVLCALDAGQTWFYSFRIFVEMEKGKFIISVILWEMSSMSGKEYSGWDTKCHQSQKCFYSGLVYAGPSNITIQPSTTQTIKSHIFCISFSTTLLAVQSKKISLGRLLFCVFNVWFHQKSLVSIEFNI